MFRSLCFLLSANTQNRPPKFWKEELAGMGREEHL
jgi:hypothetical protein